MKYFFDLDGTILDISKRYYFIYYDIIKKFGGVPLPKCVYWDYKRNKTPDDVILKRSNIPQFFLVNILILNKHSLSRINI